MSRTLRLRGCGPGKLVLHFCAPVLHTSHVHGICRLLALAGLAVFATMRLAAVEPDWQAAIKHAARANPDARIVVLDVATNQLLGANHLAETARTLAAPGSTLKPLILYQLLAESRWNADHRIACDRNLMIAGHRLACSHPLMPPYNASEALTWSCNTYFAQVARTILPGQLGPMLRATGLLGVTGIEARLHSTTLYNSVFRFDAEMLVTMHVYGLLGAHAPLMHLRRLGEGDLFSTYAESFERVWASATPAWP